MGIAENEAVGGLDLVPQVRHLLLVQHLQYIAD